MKRWAPGMACLMLLATACSEPAETVAETAERTVSVVDASVAEEVDDNAPVRPGTRFRADLPHLWCLTRIVGMESPDGDFPEIFHVWSRELDGEFHEVTRIGLTIKGESWRTRSQKTIHPGYEGEWKVDVEDETGAVLATIPFTIVPAE